MNKSMLCASILLAPLSLAMSLSDFHYDVGVGQKCVTIGKPTDAKTNIFGNQISNAEATIDANDDLSYVATNNTVVLNTDGLSRSVGYCAPVVTGSLGMKVANNIILSTELHVSGSDNIIVNDVVSDVSDVSLHLNAKSENVVVATAEFAMSNTAGGRNDLSVDPKVGLSVKAEYQFGADSNGATLGVGIIRAADEFTYNSDVLVADRAVVTTASNEIPSNIEYDADNTDPNWSLVSNNTEKYDEAGFWFGAVASASANLTDVIKLKVGTGYYMRDFDASKGYSNGVKFLVRDTGSTMSMFNVALTMSA